MRKVLFDRRSACLQPLLRQIERQNHRTLVAWALAYAEELLALFEAKYPDEQRPRCAVAFARAWARGEIKMPVARRAILGAHAAAKEIGADAAYCALAHAIGQAVSTVHVETHAIGGPMYALTALSLSGDAATADARVLAECDRLCERLLWWQNNPEVDRMPWAPFLRRDGVPNKERLLRDKAEKGR